MALVYLDDSNPIATSATSTTPDAVVSSLNEGDHAFILCNYKRPGSATLATPGGWTKLVDVQVGTGTPGADDGPVQLVVFHKQAGSGGSLTLPTLTLGGTTTGASIQAGLIVYRGDLGTSSVLDFAYTSGSDTSSGTGFSVTGGADPGVVLDDRVVVFAATTSDTPTISSPTLTQTGITYGTINNPWSTSTGNGDDMRSVCHRAIATAGTSSAAPVYGFTLSGSTTGGAAIMRLREATVEKTGTDSATMTEGTSSVASTMDASTDTAALTDSSALLRSSEVTDSATLSEASALSVSVAKTGTDTAALSEAAALTEFSITGKTTDGASSTSSSADKTVVSKFTATGSGVLAYGHARIWVTGGSANTKMVAYADSAGAPGAKLGESDVLVVTGTSEAVRGYVFTGANQAAITSGTDYWVGVAWQDPGSDSVTFSRDNTASQRTEVSAYAPDPFGTPTALTGPIDAWVEVMPVAAVEKTGTDSATLTEGSSTLGVFVGGVLLLGEDVEFGPDTYFGGEDGLDTATLSESSALEITTFRTGTDTGTLSEVAQVAIVIAHEGTDTAALTGEVAELVDVDMLTGTDSGVLTEASELSAFEDFEGEDSAELTESSELTQIFAVEDSATLTEEREIDRPGAIFEDGATLSEESVLTVTAVAPGFYFGGDQYFGEDVYFGGEEFGPGGLDPIGSVDPDRDKGFTASRTGADTPADYSVLVAITATGEIIDELNWSRWSYTDSIDWVRPGSMTVQVPLLGKDRLGDVNRRSLRNIDQAGPLVSLVLTRKGKALWAGPSFATSWDDGSVQIACASIAKLMDYRMVINPAYLLDPGNEAGTVRLEMNPRDRVVRLLEIGTTGAGRTLPILLPSRTGQIGPLVEYLASDLGTVSERVKEAVEQDGGPDVVIRPVLSLDQSTVTWQVLVEEHLGEKESQATWDYPVSVKALAGETDSSQMVTTGYVLGDTQTSVGAIRGYGIHAIDRGPLQPAMERADRTSVSNKRQEELTALAVSFAEANSSPARTWAITVHSEADPIIGEEWEVGDYVTVSVSDHPWLDDGEYVRRVIGITHDPESIQLETIAIRETVDNPTPDSQVPDDPGSPTPDPTPDPEPEPDPTPDPEPEPDPPGDGDVPWSQQYLDGSDYQIATGGSGAATSLASLTGTITTGGVYNYTGGTITTAVSVNFTGKSNITIRGITMGQGGKLRCTAGTNIVVEVNAPYELTNGGEIVKWVGVYSRVRVDNSVFGPATEPGSPPTVKSRYVQFGDSTSVGAKYGTVTRSTFRCKAGPGNPVHTVGDTGNPTGGVRYTLITGCLFQKTRPFDENDHETALMGISTLQLTDGQQIVEFCRFEDCASEPEVVSMKMNRSAIRGCTFVNHVGSASLRHGDNSKIHDCYFVSDATAGSGGGRHAAGTRCYGANHEIAYNTIRVKGGANFERPILLDTGDTAPGTTSNGHANVVNANVHHNLLVGCDSPIVIGDNYSTAPTGSITNNKIVACANAGVTGIQVIGGVSTAGITTSGNTVHASTGAAGLTTGSNGEWIDPTGATGARTPYLTAVMVGKGATYNPWS